jgi:DNA-binding MarR family transcriptional regulator
MSPTPGYLVWRLSTRWRVAVDRALAPLGLTHAQYAVLGSLSAILATGHQPTQRELADHTGLEPLYVSKLARALDAAGIVGRAGDPADTRAVRLSLTPHGQAVTDQAVTVVAGLIGRQLAPLGGLDSQRTRAFARDLQLLLDAPLEDTA